MMKGLDDCISAVQVTCYIVTGKYGLYVGGKFVITVIAVNYPSNTATARRLTMYLFYTVLSVIQQCVCVGQVQCKRIFPAGIAAAQPRLAILVVFYLP